MKKNPLEKEVKASCRRVLKKEPGKWIPYVPHLSESGIPDNVACVPIRIEEHHVGMTLGQFVGLEFKQIGKKSSALQEQKQEEIREAGGYIMKDVNCSAMLKEELKKFYDHYKITKEN